MSLLQPTRIAALLLAALALMFGVGGYRLGLWTDGAPGAGLLPFAVAALLVPLIGLVLRERDNADEPFERAPFLAIALTGAYAAMLPRVGFVLPTLLLIALWARLFHRQSWVRAMVLAVCLTGVAIGLFGFLLKVPLPLLPDWS